MKSRTHQTQRDDAATGSWGAGGGHTHPIQGIFCLVDRGQVRGHRYHVLTQT
jgi:hypothetical protein